MGLKKLRWIIKRHPFLYISRFWLLSKNSNASAIAAFSYNTLNTKETIPILFQEVNNQIFKYGKPNSDLDLVKQLASWLYHHTKVGPGLSVPSEQALKTLLYGAGGVCSDIAQVFNNFCVINDIAVREWGTTSAPYNKLNGGHSFNEFYSKELEKWVLMDASWAMIFYNERDEPLSTLEVYELSRNEQPVVYKSFIDNVVIEDEQVIKNYLQSDITPFLICDYRNTTYDRFLKLGRPYMPVFLIHFVILIFGKSYHYKFPIDSYKNIFS